jgi:hypothetical protein
MHIELILPENDLEHEQALSLLDALCIRDDVASQLAHRAQLLLLDDYAARRGQAPATSDAVGRLRTRATEMFGNAVRAGRWMYQPHYLLGGRRPVDMLGNEEETARLERLLENIGQVIELPRRQA